MHLPYGNAPPITEVHLEPCNGYSFLEMDKTSFLEMAKTSFLEMAKTSFIRNGENLIY
jgi:hypothetical protein